MRTEYASRYRAAVTRACVLAGVGLVVGFGVMAANPRFETRGWIGFVGLGIAFASIFGGAGYADRKRVTLARAAGVTCPHCSKPLIGLNAKLALTTGRCAECGQFVVGDRDGPAM